MFGDRELVAFASADHELPLAAVGDLAGDRVVEELNRPGFAGGSNS